MPSDVHIDIKAYGPNFWNICGLQFVYTGPRSIVNLADSLIYYPVINEVNGWGNLGLAGLIVITITTTTIVGTKLGFF